MHVALTLLSVSLLFAVAMLVKERRLRRALQDILRRLLKRMRSDDKTTPDHPHPYRHGDAGDDRLRQ